MDFKIMNCNLTSYNSVIGKEDYSIVSIVVFTGFFYFSAILSSRRNDSRVVWLIPRQWGTSSISRVKPNLSGWRRTSHYCVHRICYSSGGLFGCHAWHEKRGCDMLCFTYFDLQRLKLVFNFSYFRDLRHSPVWFLVCLSEEALWVSVVNLRDLTKKKTRRTQFFLQSESVGVDGIQPKPIFPLLTEHFLMKRSTDELEFTLD